MKKKITLETYKCKKRYDGKRVMTAKGYLNCNDAQFVYIEGNGAAEVLTGHFPNFDITSVSAEEFLSELNRIAS